MSKSPQELFAEKEARVNTAIALGVPDRVPVTCMTGFFPAYYAKVTLRDVMYDADKMIGAWTRTLQDFDFDTADNPFMIRFLGAIMESLDYKQLKWAGHGVDDMSGYQFVEGEYMKPEEYGEFIFDPTDFMIRRYWPRIFGALAPLAGLPPLSEIITYSMGLANFAALGAPGMREVGQALIKAADAGQQMGKNAAQFAGVIKAMGFPSTYQGFTQAPFDTLSDYFRGTLGGMMDMFRHADKLMAATEKMLPIMLRLGLATKQRGGTKVFIPLHKGLDGFMSNDQFKRFYWPSLKALMEGLIAEGLIPVVLWEGECTSRLEIIGDIPAGKAVYHFERTDIFKAKEIIGDRVCLKGNVPLSLMVTGGPDDVKAYCKKLIDVVGKGGGFILDAAAPADDAKPENLQAMIQMAKEYGRYA